MRRVLLRDEQPVPLQPKAFDTLLVLVQHSDRAVLKDDLMKALWPDSFVDEGNLAQNIFVLRKAMGDTGSEHRYIVTLPGRGYRFGEPVRTVSEKVDELLVAARSRSVITATEVPADTLPRLPGRIGRFRWAIRLAVAAILTAGVAAAWQYFRPSPRLSQGRIRLAVLPFQNLTGDPGQEYFADGLTEEMISQLGRLHPDKMSVIARTSVMGYKHSDKRLDQIGRELDVQYILEGSVRQDAGRLRITAQLISVADQTHLWAEDFDRNLQDTLAVQDGISLAVARETQLKLDPAVQTELGRGRTVNPEVLEAYLKGRYFWNKRTEQGFRKAIEYFELAIAKEPSFARAYAGLADSYLLLAGYGFETEQSMMPRAKDAALKAIAIDDHLAEPYATLGLISEQYDWNWVESEKNFQRAIALDPNYSVAHHWYGDGYLAGVGKTPEAIAELRRAQELDPLSIIISTDLANRLYLAGNHAEGIAQFHKVFEMSPDFVPAHYDLSVAYQQQGLFREAIAETEKIKPLETNPFAIGQFGIIYARQGKRAKALAMLDRLRHLSMRTYIDPGHFARIYFALQDEDAGFAWLEKACEQHAPSILGLKTDHMYDPMRSDPRFVALVRRVGLAD
jgi:TolB-like protein/DNA-binding winged helix-turn-helix (wHTH) protein